MSFYQKTGLSLLIFVFAIFGFTQVSHALTQSDVNLICAIVNCDEAGIRDVLDGLVDDESEEITRNLFRGISGDDVTALQELLATDPEIYPEGLITGFYGPLTEQAIIRFQEKFGIEGVGTVGPITRGTINKLFKKNKKGNDFLDNLIVDEDEDLDDDIEIEDEDENDDDSENRGRKDHKVIVCHKGKTIAVGAPAVQAHLGHGDEIGTCDEEESEDDTGEDEDSDDDEDEPTDKTAPDISNIDVSDIATSTATILWETNEDSDSTLWYSTTSGFSIDDDDVEKESDNESVTDHGIDLEDLDPETFYYFIVGSEDESGNLATSTEDSFETHTIE